MRITTFSAALMAVFLASVSAQAFPFEKKDTPAATKNDAQTTASSAPYLSQRFRALDTNHDGKISLEEFIRDQVDDFNRRDENKDKSLSSDELDFPPGTPENMKVMMRKQMQDQELQEQKMQAEMKKRQEEDMKRMQAEQAARQAEAAKAAAAAQKAPVVTAPAHTATAPVTDTPATVKTVPPTAPSTVKPSPSPSTTTTSDPGNDDGF